MRLHVFRSWLQPKYASHDESDLHSFTPAERDEQQLRLASKKPSESKDKISSKEASPPEKFNGCAQSWKIWKSEFEAFLAQLHGYNGTALIYVILDDEDLTDDAYEAMNQPMHDIYDASLQGTTYDRDNFLAFQKLRSQIVGSSAKTHLTSFELSNDGRGAWWHLVEQYEGKDASNAVITQARKDIENTV